jgi:hypothetical protein
MRPPAGSSSGWWWLGGWWRRWRLSWASACRWAAGGPPLAALAPWQAAAGALLLPLEVCLLPGCGVRRRLPPLWEPSQTLAPSP